MRPNRSTSLLCVAQGYKKFVGGDMRSLAIAPTRRWRLVEVCEAELFEASASRSLTKQAPPKADEVG